MKKDELRSILRQSRLGMSPEEVAAKSARIAELALANIDWPAAKSLHIYSSVDDWQEVDTTELVRQITARWPQIKVIQPQLSRDNPLPNEKI